VATWRMVCQRALLLHREQNTSKMRFSCLIAATESSESANPKVQTFEMGQAIQYEEGSGQLQLKSIVRFLSASPPRLPNGDSLCRVRTLRTTVESHSVRPGT
jgi:hypothetical protein